jgi:hypothetical protein
MAARLTKNTVAEEDAPISGLSEIGAIMRKSGKPDLRASVSKDGRTLRSYGHPSRRAFQALLSMRMS